MHSVKGYRWSQAPRWNPKCVAFQSAKGAVMASISQSNVISGQNEKLVGIHHSLVGTEGEVGM